MSWSTRPGEFGEVVFWDGAEVGRLVMSITGLPTTRPLQLRTVLRLQVIVKFNLASQEHDKTSRLCRGGEVAKHR